MTIRTPSSLQETSCWNIVYDGWHQGYLTYVRFGRQQVRWRIPQVGANAKLQTAATPPV
jgi:hypothetical protein